jgi:PAS domain S-box-containing protein
VPGLVILPGEGNIIDANAAACSFYGWSGEQITTMRIQDISQLSPGDVCARMAEVMAGTTQHFQTRHRLASGEIREMDVYSTHVSVDNRELLYSLLFDVSARLDAEKAQAALLREREMLIRELHHRTKNNLQVVSSLLGLQALGVSDPSVASSFHEMQDRIGTMALAHEKLYKAADVSRIELGSYLSDLSALVASSTERGGGVEIDTDFDSCPVSIEVAGPCGIVVNELITNSMKYAFPQGRAGKICIRVKTAGPNIRLVYEDDGVGFPIGFDPSKTTSLGLSLITSIVGEQLKGHVEFGSRPGFQCRIEFPPPALPPCSSAAGI